MRIKSAAALPPEQDTPTNGVDHALGERQVHATRFGVEGSLLKRAKGRERREGGRGHASQGALNSAKRLLKRLEKIYVGHAGK